MSGTKRAALLPVSFFRRPAEVVARELIGAVVVSTVRGTRTAGRIVEVEAYLGHRDPASHGYQHRRHAQNEGLYGPAGHWYVYLSYGVHWCANLVADREVNGGAVLLRALEPVEGLAVMRRRRGAVPDRQLAAGPGRLTQALGITRCAGPTRHARRDGPGVPGCVPGALRWPRRGSASPGRWIGPCGSWRAAHGGPHARRRRVDVDSPDAKRAHQPVRPFRMPGGDVTV